MRQKFDVKWHHRRQWNHYGNYEYKRNVLETELMLIYKIQMEFQLEGRGKRGKMQQNSNR